MEEIDANGCARLQFSSFGSFDAEFLEDFTGFDTRFRVVTGGGFGHARGATLTESDLNGGVAVRFIRLDLRHAVVRHVEHGDGNRIAVVRENTRHANLATDKAKAHDFLHSRLRLAGAK